MELRIRTMMIVTRILIMMIIIINNIIDNNASDSKINLEASLVHGMSTKSSFETHTHTSKLICAISQTWRDCSCG